MWKNPVFKTPYRNKTLQSNMAYSDAFTMKLLVIHPTRLLLCNSIGYFDGISLPPLPPNNSTNCRFLPCIIYCFIVNFFSFFSNFFKYLNEDPFHIARLKTLVSPTDLCFNLTITRRSTKACKKAKFSLNPFAEVYYSTIFFFFFYDLKLYKESYKKGKWDLAPSEKIKSVT